MTVRLGLVGLGNWGNKLASTLAGIDGVDLAACFARTEETRTAFAVAHGCRPARSLDDLVAGGLDGVLVATPHTTHVDVVETLAGLGMHIMVEKPLALTVSDARRCVDAAERAGTILQVAHYRRRLPATRAVKELIDSGELGVLHLMEGHFSRIWGPQAARPWRDDPVESPAGAMTALGVHMVDNLLYWGGPAVRVAALSHQIGGATGLDDITGALIDFANGAVGTITTSLRVPKLITCAAHGTKLTAFSDMDGHLLRTLAGNDDHTTERTFQPFDGVADNLRDFVRCVSTGAAPETGAAEGLAVVEILEAITQSAADGGTPVALAGVATTR